MGLGSLSRHMGVVRGLQGIKGKRCKLLKGERRMEAFWACLWIADTVVLEIEYSLFKIQPTTSLIPQLME